MWCCDNWFFLLVLRTYDPYLLHIQCVRKGPQLRTWSSRGPNCWNGPHLVLILHKRPHFPQLWYILGLESVFLYHKWRNIEISTSILLYMDLEGNCPFPLWGPAVGVTLQDWALFLLWTLQPSVPSPLSVLVFQLSVLYLRSSILFLWSRVLLSFFCDGIPLV